MSEIKGRQTATAIRERRKNNNRSYLVRMLDPILSTFLSLTAPAVAQKVIQIKG